VELQLAGSVSGTLIFAAPIGQFAFTPSFCDRPSWPPQLSQCARLVDQSTSAPVNGPAVIRNQGVDEQRDEHHSTKKSAECKRCSDSGPGGVKIIPMFAASTAPDIAVPKELRTVRRT
jgi:hypothetical protein